MATDAEGGVPTTSPSKPRLHQRFSTLKYTTNKLTWSGSNLIKNNSNTSKPLVFDASESSEGLVDWEKPQASPVQTEQQSMFRTGLPEVIRVRIRVYHLSLFVASTGDMFGLLRT